MRGKSSFLIILVLFFLTFGEGHFRGPHHPRNSPRVAQYSEPPGPVEQHRHYMPPKPSPGEPPAPIITHDKNLLHDQQHIKEDLGEWVTADGKEMTPEEMEFHYFKMHDFDNNSMLDGLEILQALSHILPDEPREEIDLTGPGVSANAGRPTKTFSKEEHMKQVEEDFEYYVELIDRVLEEDDMNKDGYLSYFEYVVGRKKDEKKEQERVLYSSNTKKL